ncbi:hypothetical protein B5F53_12015 [Blautia sp. An249]|uniref:3'-5' exoribonuclease n=1 Tax=Blautia sp. An249 TaxID=1965603 RepID=UPI000B373A2A|nr:3'-5' exoribonuclease [Blautia sp. An249]OUO77930.1 hypothetical protein B5F53_12015 [Blautia sp. An249]
MSLLFFDMEFTGLRQNTTPISLGIVSEDGKRFYAEFTDYNESQCDKWIKENVIKHMSLKNRGLGAWADELEINGEIIEDGIFNVYGNERFISDNLKIWLEDFDTIQFVSDVCHYDFVLLVDLLTNGGTALDLPRNISAVCHDLNMDIAQHFHMSDHEAFGMSREQIMNDLCRPEDIVTGDKHNSLYDAEVIRAIYQEIVR